ncbi:MAG: Hsp20/alpha crystallin family protein [Clostridia bacterium]|nr:Hsp20/alpha crystallin family protein [Clostridia bacterium]
MYELSPLSGALRGLSDYEKVFFPHTDFQMMNCDIEDMGKSYVLSADMPGFDKEDITLDVNEDILTISAQRNSENEKSHQGYTRRERRYGKISRSFNISNVEKDGIKATYRNGVLCVTLPKQEREGKHSSRICID